MLAMPGALLVEAKSLVAHGQWQPWLAANFEGSKRTAQSYMQLANGWEQISKSENSALLSVDGALKLLRGPSVDKSTKTPTGLGELPEPIQVYLLNGAISEAHAWQLLRLKEVYQNLSADFTHWKDSGYEFQTDGPRVVWGLLQYGIRPEDWPVCLFRRLLEDGDPGVLSDGCESFFSLVAESYDEYSRLEAAVEVGPA